VTGHSRRQFLQGTVGALAAYAVLPRQARADVNSQIRIATIGLNGRGQSHIDAFADNLVALCDCDTEVLGKRADQFEKKHHRKLDTVTDYRKLLERSDIDAVSIATPSHSHSLIAIAAAEAGKHVYCEKPVSQCVWEGRQLANAARHYDRLIQCGTQARSSKAIQQAVEHVQSGKLGKIKSVVGTCYKPRPSIGKLDKPLVIPESVDYDLWCGPAARVDLYRPKFHYDWHWDFNTGCGDIGNQGIHQMDIARWFLGEPALAPRVMSIGGRLGYEDAGNTPNTQTVLYDYPAAPLVFETRGLPKSIAAQANQQEWEASMDHYLESQRGVIVHCEQGHVSSADMYDRVLAFDPDGKQIQEWTGGGDHFKNFLDAVRSGRREDLRAEVLEGHLSSALCHLGNISHRLGEKRTASEIAVQFGDNAPFRDSFDRMIAHLRANDVDVEQPVLVGGALLLMDPAREQFTNNEAANHLLRREDRAPFAVPEIA
jgi:predicted dehydrogenase